MFYGNYDLSVDDKNRMLIPAEVRKQMDVQRDGEGFFLMDGENDVPWLFTESAFNKLASQYNTDMTPDADLMDYYRVCYGSACRLEWDKQYRVLVPARTKEQMRIGAEVTLVGVNDHLELWNTQAWNTKLQELKQQKPMLVLKIKHAKELAQARQQNSGTNA